MASQSIKKRYADLFVFEDEIKLYRGTRLRLPLDIRQLDIAREHGAWMRQETRVYQLFFNGGGRLAAFGDDFHSQRVHFGLEPRHLPNIFQRCLLCLLEPDLTCLVGTFHQILLLVVLTEFKLVKLDHFLLVSFELRLGGLDRRQLRTLLLVLGRQELELIDKVAGRASHSGSL